ncbi:hypothetical protein EYC84_004815 [Monilinia fructicola]|uniref:Uncharacterized protein n=1 Tax=Monilinia fructicola TaxID=38448 RepID=A0A5M9K6M6_MONFR|nr:hypothetical protein EYC84_004815 [Monilinia fructicola]
MGLYKTQQDLMAKMATEKGIQISEITTHFQQKLSQVYEENPHCAESWALGRAEYSVWKQFFPEDPWPGTSPITTPSNTSSTTLTTMQAPLEAKTMGSESGEIIELPDKKVDQSSLPDKPKPTLSLKIEDILLTAAGNSKILVSYKEALENTKRRYPRENPDWQNWMSGNKVWTSNFRQNGVFPCNEPPRSYVLLSSTDQPSTRYPRRHGEDQSRHGWRSGGSWQAQHGASWRRSRSPPTGPRGGYGAIRPYDSAIKGRAIQSQEYLERSHSSTYEPKESFMEKKALARGGDFLRHAFFRTLQKSRDEVRENYSEVDRLLKHWLADKLTWERIFQKEPFPWLSEKPPAFPLSDENPSGKHTGNTSMAPPPQAVSKKFKFTASVGDDLLANSNRDQFRSANNVRDINFNQSRASSNGRNSFDQTGKLGGAVIPFGSSPEMPRRFPEALPNKGLMGRTTRTSETSDSARLKAHTRTISNISNVQSEKNPVEGTRDVVIRRNTIFRALLGEWDGSFKSVQRALGDIDDASEHLRLTIEPYQPGDNVALDRAYKFLEVWKKMIYSDHLIKLDHFWTQFKTHDTMTTINYQAVVHVNGKKIRCPGKFGDLCEFFSREIQTYQSTMAEFDDTENALACSTIFEARPYNIYLTSYPFPIMLRVDTKTRNNVLDKHDAFLEEWVRSIKDIRSATSLADMSNAYGRRRDQRLMGMEMDLDLDDLLKEGAAKANQKRSSQAAECDEDSGRRDKRRCL